MKVMGEHTMYFGVFKGIADDLLSFLLAQKTSKWRQQQL